MACVRPWPRTWRQRHFQCPTFHNMPENNLDSPLCCLWLENSRNKCNFSPDQIDGGGAPFIDPWPERSLSPAQLDVVTGMDWMGTILSRSKHKPFSKSLRIGGGGGEAMIQFADWKWKYANIYKIYQRYADNRVPVPYNLPRANGAGGTLAHSRLVSMTFGRLKLS